MLALSAVVAVGLVVTGCTGEEPEPTPSVEETVEPSPTETPEPEPTEDGPVKPERPAAMDRDDAEGAAAAAEYFLELYPYVMSTGDTAEWEAMSHAECGYCTSALESATWLRENSATFSGGVTSVEILDSYGRDTDTGIYPLEVSSVQEAISVVDQDGVVVEDVQQSESKFRVEIGRNAGAWVVVEVAPTPGTGA